MTDRVRRRLAEIDRRLDEENERNRREMEEYFSEQMKRIEKENVERIQHHAEFINSLFTIK